MKTEQHLPPRLPRQTAFTLVELLTVIAIIGILAAIIIPVTARVRASARAAKCLSNLRQVFMAANFFSMDHNMEMPRRTFQFNDDIWPYAYPNIPYRTDWDPADKLPAKFNNTVFECIDGEKDNAANKRSYGINEAFRTSKAKAWINKVETPSQTAYFGEVLNSSNLGPTRINPRHNNRANVVFVDGHAKAVELTAEILDPDGPKNLLPFWVGGTDGTK
ncbi:prepilin-type N-terminal cleavage/methylation domain-containing protein [Opitutaceae bacterium TAV4]|nr:prepilin-type N-terminal cleavage/methylation domain-containing protein [Opitutaceae bacterium TAV4]RRK00432.1 prepilin-type N-terminal cleavage/methylation domain-containing protein [Opitutaceae bacterium TAV3]